MNKSNRKKGKGSQKNQTKPTYTHRDASGMSWRFVGNRPISSLADAVMRDCGISLPH